MFHHLRGTDLLTLTQNWQQQRVSEPSKWVISVVGLYCHWYQCPYSRGYEVGCRLPLKENFSYGKIKNYYSVSIYFSISLSRALEITLLPPIFCPPKGLHALTTHMMACTKLLGIQLGLPAWQPSFSLSSPLCIKCAVVWSVFSSLYLRVDCHHYKWYAWKYPPWNMQRKCNILKVSYSLFSPESC